MNKTKTPTVDKKTFPLRLPPNTYRQVRSEVQKEKDKGNYAYSINDYLTEIIEKELHKNRKKNG
ncbi:MAG: hypothetical protein IKF53_02985 [Clostridia bacterium]|nr:hypothetical protein [Clostridia bacterium]